MAQTAFISRAPPATVGVPAAALAVGFAVEDSFGAGSTPARSACGSSYSPWVPVGGHGTSRSPTTLPPSDHDRSAGAAMTSAIPRPPISIPGLNDVNCDSRATWQARTIGSPRSSVMIRVLPRAWRTASEFSADRYVLNRRVLERQVRIERRRTRRSPLPVHPSA